jgi:hypothetical protein
MTKKFFLSNFYGNFVKNTKNLLRATVHVYNNSYLNFLIQYHTNLKKIRSKLEGEVKSHKKQ